MLWAFDNKKGLKIIKKIKLYMHRRKRGNLKHSIAHPPHPQRAQATSILHIKNMPFPDDPTWDRRQFLLILPQIHHIQPINESCRTSGGARGKSHAEAHSNTNLLKRKPGLTDLTNRPKHWGALKTSHDDSLAEALRQGTSCSLSCEGHGT